MAAPAKSRRGKIATPSRPYWTGSIKLSLVTLPVNVFSGIDPAGDVHFHQIDRKSGKRVRYQKIVPGAGEVQQGDIVKGFEFEKGRYAIIEPEELKALKIESKDSFVVARFVDRGEIDAIYFDQPYFVAPANDAGMDAFIVIRDAMRAMAKIGIGQIVLGGHERLAALQPCGRGMLLETLHYANEIKRADRFFAVIKERKSERQELDLARSLIEKNSGPFQPDKFTDRYEDAVRALIATRKKRSAKPEEKEEPPQKTAEVIDLMEALKQSVAKSAGASRRPNSAKPTSRKIAGAKRR